MGTTITATTVRAAFGAIVATAAFAALMSPVTSVAADQQGVYVVAEAITTDGHHHDEDGDANTTGASTTTTATACGDTAYTLKPWKLGPALTWYYNGTGVPANIAGTAQATITTSTQTVATGANRCGLPTLTTTWTAGGATTLKPQINGTTCTGNDGKSVTGWGTLPAKVLAYTCTYYNSRGQVLASDTLIDNVAYTWFTTKPATCTNQYDLETTMTHERLHTAGLGHVDQTRNAAQTMTPSSAPCDTSRRLLGAGDYAGLKANRA